MACVELTHSEFINGTPDFQKHQQLPKFLKPGQKNEIRPDTWSPPIPHVHILSTWFNEPLLGFRVKRYPWLQNEGHPHAWCLSGMPRLLSLRRRLIWWQVALRQTPTQTLALLLAATSLHPFSSGKRREQRPPPRNSPRGKSDDALETPTPGTCKRVMNGGCLYDLFPK